MSEAYSKRAIDHLQATAAVYADVMQQCVPTVLEASAMIAETFRQGGRLLLCGNGGSAADCQHMAAEFVSRLTIAFERPGLSAIALTTDSSFLTAFANDCGFEGIFDRQVRAIGRPGDVLLGITTSGTSRNVVLALEAARAMQMRSIVLSGIGGRVRRDADVVIAVPSNNTQQIQEAHLAIEHIICDLVEQELFGPGAPPFAPHAALTYTGATKESVA